MEFIKLDLEHRVLFEKYKPLSNPVSSVHNFTALYMWKDALGIEISEVADVLYIRRTMPPIFGFLPPLAQDEQKLSEAIERMKQFADVNEFPAVIIDAETWVAEKLETQGIGFKIKEDRDNDEYLYDGERLRNLSGKKMHGKKNHYNNFVKNNEFTVRPLADSKSAILEMAKRWLKGRESAYTIGEFAGIKNSLENLSQLPITGSAVFINGRCEGFTISEPTSPDSVLVHVEKANDEINGMFTFINSENLRINHPTATIINREQDLGIEGLRKAKESWKPTGFVHKFIIDLD